MPLFIHEDSKKLNKRQITLPDEVANKLKDNATLYKKDKTSKGYKRLMALTDKSYNKRSDKKDRQNNDKTTVSFGDARRIVSDLENMPQTNTNKEFTMVGGHDTLYALKNGLKQARASVKQVMPVPPVQQIDKHPDKVADVQKPVQMGNLSLTVNESVLLREGFDFYEDYYYEYGISYVLDRFYKNPKEVQTWGPLIDPSQYKTALAEFTKYGEIMRFPANKIYQWLGIIMRNTCILNANTDLAGHSAYSAIDDISTYFENKVPNYIGYEGTNYLLFRISESEFYQMCSENNLMEDYGVHKDGQLDMFMNQDEVNEYDRQSVLLKYKTLMDEFNESQKAKYRDAKVYYDSKWGSLVYSIDYMQYFEDQGLYETMYLPDGSDAISDYGLKPLFDIISEYDGSQSPEEVLVIVNKALDVYHMRGDLASAFVEGGSKALTRISEALKKKRGGKTIYLNERQIHLLKEYHGDLKIPFNHPDQPYDPKLNYEHFVDFLESIGKYGMLEPSKYDATEVYSLIDKGIKNTTIDACDSAVSIDDYEWEDVFDNLMNSYELQQDMFTDLDVIQQLESAKENGDYSEIDLHYIYDHMMTPKGRKLVNDSFSGVFHDRVNFIMNPTVDKRGLIYIERAITIPSAEDEKYTNDREGDEYYNNSDDFYQLMKKIYDSVGNCWTYMKGCGEAYCAHIYPVGNNDVILRGYVNPDDVNWTTTFALNFISPDEYELRLNPNAMVEVDEVVLADGNKKGLKLPLKGPIIVPA